ncbi:MAG: protein kinase [Muribaculaceae bacterium]|nr:protein kinase [Muribaculaceae bacterium]
MRTIGQYRVDDKPIGTGGMGQVLRGVGPDGTPVAIKEILPQYVSDPEYRQRIEREILFLMQFDHRSVVRIYDHFELDGKLYIVMELVDGLNLEDFVNKNGAIPWQQSLRFMTNILDAMDHVHSKGVIHRDIKPGNIMIRENGEICLLDFGVAKSESLPGMTGTQTVLGSIIGTDGYMSPEQAGGLTINYRADIYALGCVLYFMLTGRHAYAKLSSDYETQYAILNKPFPKVSDVKAGIPLSVENAISKAVDRNMTARYDSCAEFRDRLLRLLNGGTEVGTRTHGQNISLTIGRENCDIPVDPNNTRISRHHATVTRKQFTGGVYYVFTDNSSNGTLINGMVYTKGMSYNIRAGENPEILLAGEPTARLDIQDIMHRLDRIANIANGEVEGGGSAAGAGEEGAVPPGDKHFAKYSDADSLGQAFKNVFNNYANFKGRAGRGEYWWWFLFNVFVGILFSVIFIATDFDMNVLYVTPIWSLVTLIPNLAVGVRRFHDIGKSGGLFFLLTLLSGFFVPAIFLIVFLCRKGDPLMNKYGPGSSMARGAMRG